ncbi:MAG: hypothetical protein HETSPECPRED_006958 [Heterodermia speciosa]|uniref:Uncharacterized protein n=1 Tax=Heterodermia speciosa TaxID=116794 RepID=A0A8H3FQE0_9LECA|nr:MAG: hypothetical protein HETSPECPRED_006958 [Heterodermia speciosa]
MVNVLEVPTEAETLNETLLNAASSSIESTVFTLDPHQKYRALRPLGCKIALTKSDVTSPKSPSEQKRTQVASSEMQRSHDENKLFPHFYHVLSDLSGVKHGGRPISSGPLSNGSTLMTIFHRFRGTRSAGYVPSGQETHSPQNSGREPFELVPRKPLSLERAMESAYSKSAVPGSHVGLVSRPQAPKPRCAESIGAKKGTESHHARERRVPAGSEVPPNGPLRSEYQITPLCTSFEQRGLQCADQLASPKVRIPSPEAQDASDSQILDLLDDKYCQVLGQGSRLSNSSNALMGKASSTSGNVKQCSSTEPPNKGFPTSLGHSLSSNASSFPHDLSELDLPLSPCVEHRYQLFHYERNHDDATITDEEHARPGQQKPTQPVEILPTAAGRGEWLSSSCFSKHNLPPVKQASGLTTKLSHKAPYPSQYSASTLINSNARTDRILVWSGESKHHLTATEELADDLGYLGEVIL